MRPALAARTVRGIVWLTLAMLQRLLREGLILRSMIWPGLVCAGTLLATLVALLVLRPGRDVAVTPDIDPAIVAEFEDEGLRVRTVEDPAPRVRAGRLAVATDGRTVWALGTSLAAVHVEEILRRRVGAPWRPIPQDPPSAEEAPRGGDGICKAMALLFVLYGLVFGLGGVARDRDAGILEVELALPLPRWASGFARWLASTLVLAGFFGVTVLVFGAIVPVLNPLAVLSHGIAAFGTAVAVGIAVVGTAGLRQGFSGPFAIGMTLTTALASTGLALGLDWVPIASLFAETNGGTALACSIGIGGLSAVAYGRRTGG